MDMVSNKFKIMKTIHVAMIFSIIIYGVIVYYMNYNAMLTQKIQLKEDTILLIKYFALGVSFLIFLIVLFLKKFLVNKAQNNALNSNEEDKLSLFCMKYSTSYFIWIVLCEIPSIAGLSFAFAFGSMGINFGLLLILISLVLMIIFSPRLKDIEEMDQKLQYL